MPKIGEFEMSKRMLVLLHWLGDTRYGKPLRGWRAAACRATGMHESVVYNLEQGNYAVHRARALEAADHLGISPLYFTWPEPLPPDAFTFRQSEEDMSIRRDDVDTGGTVFLKGPRVYGRDQPPKLHRAQVLDVMRAAVRIRLLEDGRELVAHFKDLEPDHDYLQERAAREEQRRARLSADSGKPVPKPEPPKPPIPPPPSPMDQQRFVPPPPRQPAVALKLVAEPDLPRDEFDSWIEMGRDVLAPIENELEGLRLKKDALEAERIAIDDELGVISKRIPELQRRKESLSQLLKNLKGENAAQRRGAQQ